jgi:hypothetical protein
MPVWEFFCIPLRELGRSGRPVPDVDRLAAAARPGRRPITFARRRVLSKLRSIRVSGAVVLLVREPHRRARLSFATVMRPSLSTATRHRHVATVDRLSDAPEDFEERSEGGVNACGEGNSGSAGPR